MPLKNAIGIIVEAKFSSGMTAMTQAKPLATFAEIQKIAEQIVERFHPQRVILFGSYAHGKPTEDSDVDLLVVMETGDEDPFRITQHIRNTIDPPVRHEMDSPLPTWVDIHVMAPSEFEASLLRKGVFVTNISTKGLVLYEAPEATPIAALIAQQRGWEGPGMKPETLEWVEKAEGDLAVAQRAMQPPNPIYDAVCFHAQQCTEKYLKAFLEEHNIMFPKTHNLIELLNLSGRLLPELDPLRPGLARLSGYAVIPRYRGFRANRRAAEEAVKTAEQVRATVREKLGLA